MQLKSVKPDIFLPGDGSNVTDTLWIVRGINSERILVDNDISIDKCLGATIQQKACGHNVVEA